ncbi:MAG: hypothetical protein HWD62_03765 [Cyclobacteriaceae bacterium]|nr:MAG: hypothetical protein HWD62_03765 [Cyclobacteriaceae bacterium]
MDLEVTTRVLQMLLSSTLKRQKNRVFEKLRSADNIRVVIHQGASGDNSLYYTNESGGVQTVYIHYDPNSDGTADGVIRTGITSLAHELKHGEQKLDGEDTESPVLDSDQTSETDRNGYDQERTVKIGEFGAVDSENKVRSSLGLGIRKSYDGFGMSNRTYSNDNRRVNIPGIGTYTGKVTVTKSGISYASFSGKTAQAVFSKLWLT